jgi:hypothetical protein
VLASHILTPLSYARRYSKELGEFRNWCKVAEAAVKQSGVAAEEVLEEVSKFKRPSTAIFIKYKYYDNPMCVPPWHIDAETAAGGGEGNSMIDSQRSAVHDVDYVPQRAQG